MSGIDLLRVNLSLPCNVPVLPGTPDTDAPIEQRTEYCAVDAWWMVGRAMICSHHLAELLGPGEFADVLDEYPLNATELKPWAEMHRYDQATAVPDWERV